MFSKSLKTGLFCFLLCLILLAPASLSVRAQTEDELKEALVKGVTLFEQQRYVEAVPYLELLVKAMPEEAKLRFLYGFALVAKSKQISNLEESKQLSAKALEEFKAAKKLGMNEQSNENMINLLSGNTSAEASTKYSQNAEANKMMSQAESYFTRSEYEKALEFYQKALALDPNIYEAALYAGDAYTHRQDWKNAEMSYQKAIAINPNRETAYRYSATPFMKQEKYDQARDRYIEALITEPYSRMSPRGISQWAQVTGAKLGHPKIDVPEFKYDPSGKPTTVMSENSLTEGSKAWVAYSLTRDSWNKEKFAKTFPNEKKYRHTLREETDALRSVLKMAKEQNLSNPQFDTLQKLDGEGLLESYVLMTQADEGIAQDHEEYLKTNRAKLRQYVLNYVIQAK